MEKQITELADKHVTNNPHDINLPNWENRQNDFIAGYQAANAAVQGYIGLEKAIKAKIIEASKINQQYEKGEVYAYRECINLIKQCEALSKAEDKGECKKTLLGKCRRKGCGSIIYILCSMPLLWYYQTTHK